MNIRWIAVLLVTGTLTVSSPARANRQAEIDPETGRVRVKLDTCTPRLDGPPPPPLPTSSDLLVPAGSRTVWLKRDDVFKTHREIANANGWIHQQPPVLTIVTSKGPVQMEYFDAWAKASEWGKHGPRLEAWGQAQAIARGATPAEFAAALATWKQGRRVAAQQEVQRIEQRFLDQHGVSLQDASRAAGLRK